ncbi:MAG: phosphate ABC transporter substrate-binding protein PstS [Microbacterium sp.]|uniref:phosphate ABC transporter substrate-binding protein PstS n=1 Tax=Microbacterium sp. TaxID=51671 RepID=UPI001ACC66D2|nr:phosphate ABC transporter substrate-binding protein PstS [Microbacterium sp.]MBN9153303.1 phosphate ABC transporter substrate-binding protein PstS [Microbacterium sp.]
MTRRLRRAVTAALALALAVAVAPFASTSAAVSAGTTYVAITGSGSTWSQNALDQWRKNVSTAYGMTVNYTGNGSTAGRTDFINGSVDFAISEIPFQARPQDGSAPERPSRAYAYMPIVAGGTSFMYNLKIGGKRVTNLRLSGDVITKIFLGQITRWNDKAITADNPALAMPDKAITPIVRSDGSGTSAQFTLWMSKQYSSLWKTGMTSQFPTPRNGKAQAGSLGVAGYVSQTYGEGAIGYVEYSYALKSGFPVAKVLNRAGYYIEPTADSVAVALLKAQINTDPNSPDYLTQILDGVYNNDDRRTYPLSSYSYMIVPTKAEGIFTEKKGQTLGAFAQYVLCQGQQRAAELGYSPLPMNLVLAGSDQLKRIPGWGKGIDTSNCDNPTFKPGDSPSNNQVALKAPQPQACDKQGPTQCATGTAGAKTNTPVSSGNAASGGGATSGGAGTGSSGGAATGGSAAGTGDPVYDANGALVSGQAASVGGAVATPFTAPTPAWGPAQWLMVAAVVLLLALIAAPAVAMRHRRSSRPTPPASR